MKVIVRIKGGLGNQLFSYSAARRLALVNSAELVIDSISGFKFDHTYLQQYQLQNFNIHSRLASYTERLEPFSRLRRFFKRFLSNKVPFFDRSYIQQRGNNFDPKLLNYFLSKTTYLEGYWQSEKYFKDIEAIIRQDLQITPPTDKINIAFSERIRSCKSIAVHVRFFDSPNSTGINNAPAEYYNNAIRYMQNIVPGAHYFIFSDKPEAARALINLPDSMVTLISHNKGDKNAYADLWLMTQCQNFIIANSTFSWWGAWLAEYANKHVIAPGFKIGHGITAWGFEGLLPNDWIKL